MLKAIGNVLLDDAVADTELRKSVFLQIDKEDLKIQITESETWLTGKFSHVFNLVVNKFNYFRRFAPALLEHLEFSTENEKSDSLINAINILRDMNNDNKRKLPDNAPINFIPSKLQHVVAPQGNVDRHAWECALLTSLRDEIKSGNLSVKDSKRYGQFNHFFISNREWKKLRIIFFKRAGLPNNPCKVAHYLKTRLNSAYDKFLINYSENKYARIEDDHWALSVDPAETFTTEETTALEKLKSWLTTRMRSIKLPQLLIEVDNDLHFTSQFMLPSKQTKREVDNVRSILVTIMAHGCFIGPYTMARLTQGVTYEQIRRITDWQLTEDAQRLALAIMVNAISKLDITRQWGFGKTSSSDGQRFECKRKINSSNL